MKKIIRHSKILLSIILLKVSSLNCFAQTDNEYMDLLLLFVDEKYEVCYNKSIKYTEKEKTKKDPLPFLFVSMSSFEMSRDHKYTNTFPKAYKTAISYAAKYRKKDKEYKFKSDSEKFIDDFKLIIIEEIENYIQEGIPAKFGKAAGLSKKICDMDPDDYGAKLMYALLCDLTKNKTPAKEYMKVCVPKLEQYKANDKALKDMSKSQQTILRFALLEYSNYYKPKEPAKAKQMLEYGKAIYYEKNMYSKIGYNNEYKLKYDAFDS